MQFKKEETQFTVESNGKTYIVPFTSNIILDGDKTYYSIEITWDETIAPATLQLIEDLSAPILKKK